MINLEKKLISYTEPSSTTEKEKQERTERMIYETIKAHEPFNDCNLKVYAKGSYANNTNVSSDSDVDIAVQCKDVFYWDESEKGNYIPGKRYEGIWTPKKLREELISALEKKFSNQIDITGSTAIQINSSSARVNADVVPCFSYRYYMKTNYIEGTKIFKTNGSCIVNYPEQQIKNGTNKNIRTNYSYKKGVRLLKRIENIMAENKYFNELPSFFMECLAYNCPNEVFLKSTWIERLKGMLFYIWDNLQGDEPNSNHWLEVNECFYLFHEEQEWSRENGRDFAKAAWNFFDLKNA